MKKVALLCLGLAMGAANAAEAQLTMQMSNGWSFTFAGNVNAFVDLPEPERRRRHRCTCGPRLGKDFSFGTGLLPAFAVFDAKGKEGETSISACTSASLPRSRPAATTPASSAARLLGAQIDMRQVYLTAGGTWGSLLMGKELGLFQRGRTS